MLLSAVSEPSQTAAPTLQRDRTEEPRLRFELLIQQSVVGVFSEDFVLVFKNVTYQHPDYFLLCRIRFVFLFYHLCTTII